MAPLKAGLVAVVGVLLLVLPQPAAATGRSLKTFGLLGSLFGFFGGELAGETPFLDAHNKGREGQLGGYLSSGRFVGEGFGFGGHNYAPYPALPKLNYHPHLADLAQSWAEHLITKGGVLEHNPNPHISSIPGASIGENLAIYKTSNSGDSPDAHKIVGGWAAEREFYDIGSNTCHAPGGLDNTCDHYKQIMSRKTMYAGCGVARGNRDQHKQYTWVVVCNYLNSCPHGKPY